MRGCMRRTASYMAVRETACSRHSPTSGPCSYAAVVMSMDFGSWLPENTTHTVSSFEYPSNSALQRARMDIRAGLNTVCAHTAIHHRHSCHPFVRIHTRECCAMQASSKPSTPNSWSMESSRHATTTRQLLGRQHRKLTWQVRLEPWRSPPAASAAPSAACLQSRPCLPSPHPACVCR
jgi:hypothetical protein